MTIFSSDQLSHVYQTLTPLQKIIPAGRFAYGLSQNRKDAIAAELAIHPDNLNFHSHEQDVDLPDFWIDQYPVTVGQFLYFMSETGYEIEFNGWLAGWTELSDRFARQEPEILWCPVYGVSSADALAYASWVGKRIPSEFEWEKAAGGPHATLYPWGNEFKPVAPLSGILAFDSAVPVGQRTELASAYGVEDMKGGVMEWVGVSVAPKSKTGICDPNSYLLAGSSLLHRSQTSHLVSSRFSWHQDLRAYNTGFRCVSDQPVESSAIYTSPQRHLCREVEIRPGLYGNEPIRLTGYSRPTFKIEVPWFPDSLWRVDVPEGFWGPFGGANAWPKKDEAVWKIDWQTHSPSHISYERDDGSCGFKVDVQAEGDVVTMWVTPDRIGRLDLLAVCSCTFSPFFSSQEKLTQFRIQGRDLVSARDMPVRDEISGSFHWSLGDALEHGAVVNRSLDGSSYMVLIGQTGCDQRFGNLWPHCAHFSGESMLIEEPTAISYLFFVGSQNDMIDRVKEVCQQHVRG